ncbi:amino acid adenylation domain-containing protein, partial [Pseudomonas aeruginosa]
MQERHGLPLRSFSSGKALTAGRAARPEVAQERRYLQGAPLGLELPGRIALRDPHCAWQWFEPEAAAQAFPAAHWLAAFLVLLGRYGNEEITLGFPEPITVRGRQAPALLRSAYRALESSAERSARLAEELDDARRQLSAEGQERAALAGRCAVQVLAARPTASSPGWLALVLAADGSVGLALRDPQYDGLRRIAGHLARLARGLVDAQACVGRLPWLDADEERRLQALRSEPQAAPPRGVLHHLFEAQARRTPQRIAVHAADRSLSYAELERESAALAARLRAAGVAPEQRVGVCLRRDSGLLVGLLGVLRAGGCYVPLDPAYPEERVAYMLDDADCLLVLVDASTHERVAALGRPCLALEEGGDQANDLALPASEVGAEHLAYIIYTSGSTGRPKGVAIEHGSAHAFLRWAGQHYAAEEWSGVLAATSVCFDLSVYELFGTLAEGGTLHLVENLFSLPDYPRRDEISLLNTVPSVCAALLALGDLPGGVRTLNLAGEPLRSHLVRQIRGQPQVRRLVNLYGPTEDTTYSTVHELDLHAEALDEPPIGRPLPGTTVEVLDGFEAPLPLGVAGELYLGGIGLARGYFGKPEQTAERFRVDPGSGERRYRTGDRVRMREDGVLEHLGRLDDQVKFNGFRIELGE